jgi:hypothetical protein
MVGPYDMYMENSVSADKLYHNMPYQPHLVKRNNVITIFFGCKSNILLLIIPLYLPLQNFVLE